MELVTIPFSQRTRSSPVMRSQPMSLRGKVPAVVRSAASWAAVSNEAPELDAGVISEWASDWISEWGAEVIADGAHKLCVHCDYTVYGGQLCTKRAVAGVAVSMFGWGYGW